MFPTVQVPIYELTLPSNNKKIKYHPFTVKEKKLFLLVKEANNLKDIINQVKQVIKNCIISPPDLDVDELPIIDIEMLFLHLKARADGEVQELEFECKNLVNEKPCGGITKVPFNFLEAKITETPGHSNKISLAEKIGVVMKYPTYGMSQVLTKVDPTEGEILDIIVDCIDYVYDSDRMYYAKDEKREDLVKWFENLSENNLKKIMQFFDTAPKLVGTSKFKCGKCGYEEDIKLEGIQDFFS